MKEVQLKCSVSNGMFPGEAGASFFASNGEAVSLFCAEEYINRAGKLLKVKLFDVEGSEAAIRLPAEPLEGHRIVRVNLDQVIEVQTT